MSTLDEEQGARLVEDCKRLQEEQLLLLREHERLLARQATLYQQQASLILKLRDKSVARSAGAIQATTKLLCENARHRDGLCKSLHDNSASFACL